MNKKPHILITNDDGISAPGIKHLWNALKEYAEITIVAPNTEQSGSGMAITTRHPLVIEEQQWEDDTRSWSVTGTPTDSIKLALSVLLETPPDLIATGINRGTNAGRNILYSGTVAGAIEGVMQNIPSVAFSCLDYENPIYHIYEEYIPQIINYILTHKLPEATLLNVNFPRHQEDGIKGVKMTRQGKGFWGEEPDKREHHSSDHNSYWLGAKVIEFDEHEESDVYWLNKGYIVAAPIHIGDLTDHQHLNEHKNQFEKHLSSL